MARDKDESARLQELGYNPDDPKYGTPVRQERVWPTAAGANPNSECPRCLRLQGNVVRVVVTRMEVGGRLAFTCPHCGLGRRGELAWQEDNVEGSSKVRLSRIVFDQLMLVRDSGLTNMFDRTAVQRIAFEMDLYELVNWIEDNPRNDYARVVMEGADVEEGDGNGG